MRCHWWVKQEAYLSQHDYPCDESHVWQRFLLLAQWQSSKYNPIAVTTWMIEANGNSSSTQTLTNSHRTSAKLFHIVTYHYPITSKQKRLICLEILQL